jgi:hypothetical protein
MSSPRAPAGDATRALMRNGHGPSLVGAGAAAPTGLGGALPGDAREHVRYWQAYDARYNARS